MNNITVTIELCAEDRARLDNIHAALKSAMVLPAVEAEAVAPLQSLPQEAPAQEAPAPAEELPFEPEPKKQEAPAPAPAAPAPAAPAPKPAEAAPEVDTATLQSKVVQLVNAGKRDETRAIILDYAKCVSDIPAEKRAEVLSRLNKLEG